MNLSVELGRFKLKNPVTVASGTFGYGEEYADVFDLNQLGAIAVKGLTLKPRKGNEPQRIVETPLGMLNSIGLQNVGVDAFIREKIPFLKQYDIQIIANINGETTEEYEALAERLNSVPEVAAVEINLSCPNVKAGGIHFGTDPEKIYEVTSKVRAKFSRAVLTKLSPNVTDIVPMAEAVRKAGGDAVCVINTLLGMAIDIHKRRPVIKSKVGGLSGPAIKPIAIRFVHEIHQNVDIPILGMGGISTPEDAIEFLIAGASAIAIGTANFYDPLASIKILEGLKSYMIESNLLNVSDLIGSLKLT